MSYTLPESHSQWAIYKVSTTGLIHPLLLLTISEVNWLLLSHWKSFAHVFKTWLLLYNMEVRANQVTLLTILVCQKFLVIGEVTMAGQVK